MTTKPKISYCLWINKEAEEAVNYYVSIFKNAKPTDIIYNPVDTPSGKTGTVLTTSFELEGQEFMILNGGPEFKLNPSISFLINCATANEVETLWNKLSEGGKERMPLDKYPFSDKYGWIEDKYGVNWQLILPKAEAPQKIVPSMMFVNEVYGKVEEAIAFYTAVFKDAKTGIISRYGKGMEPDKEEAINYAGFQLEGQWFAAMESAHKHNFHFDEGISFMVHCETQDEIDYYWNRLTEGGKEVACGWLRDKYGVAWQIVPNMLLKQWQSEDKEKSKRVMQAMMKMVKLDIAALEQA